MQSTGVSYDRGTRTLTVQLFGFNDDDNAAECVATMATLLANGALEMGMESVKAGTGGHLNLDFLMRAAAAIEEAAVDERNIRDFTVTADYNNLVEVLKRVVTDA